MIRILRRRRKEKRYETNLIVFSLVRGKEEKRKEEKRKEGKRKM